MSVLYIVSTPIGNLKDITFRAVDVLKEVDFVIAEDTRRTKILLNHLGIQKECISFYKPIEEKKVDGIVSRLKKEKGALVSDSGTPLISDPGYILVKKAIEEDIKVVPIPGPSSVLAALVASGIPPIPFTFLGFLPKGNKRKELLKKLKDRRETLIFFESPERLRESLKDMLDVFKDRMICVAREITKMHEEFVRGRIPEVIEHFEEINPKGEICIVVEGAKEKPQEAWEEKAEKLVESGYSVKDAAKIVSILFNVPKNRVYAFLKDEVRS